MDNNSLSYFASTFEPSVFIKDGHFYVNIPIAGIYDHRLESEKYEKYKTLNNFCLFRILCQSKLTKTNSKNVSIAASDLWKYVSQDFKDSLQRYCDYIKSRKNTFHFKGLYNRKDYNKPRNWKKKPNETNEILPEIRWIQREEFMNQYFQDEIKELNFVETEPCNFNPSQYYNIIYDARKAEFVDKPKNSFLSSINKQSQDIKELNSKQDDNVNNTKVLSDKLMLSMMNV
ncbi:unnamed protein product [Rhizophagus irregularis]|nr:unnamed protein product [Rhizophagus irregularis]